MGGVLTHMKTLYKFLTNTKVSYATSTTISITFKYTKS